MKLGGSVIVVVYVVVNDGVVFDLFLVVFVTTAVFVYDDIFPPVNSRK